MTVISAAGLCRTRTQLPAHAPPRPPTPTRHTLPAPQWSRGALHWRVKGQSVADRGLLHSAPHPPGASSLPGKPRGASATSLHVSHALSPNSLPGEQSPLAPTWHPGGSPRRAAGAPAGLAHSEELRTPSLPPRALVTHLLFTVSPVSLVLGRRPHPQLPEDRFLGDHFFNGFFNIYLFEQRIGTGVLPPSPLSLRLEAAG